MPLAQADIAAAGKMFADAWNGRTTFPALPAGLVPATLEEAVAIQDATAAVIGQPIVGWKIGGGPGPLVGRVYGEYCHANPARLSTRQYPEPRVECESGFRLTKDLPARAAEYTKDEVLSAAVLCFTIELTGSRITGGKHTPDTEDEKLLIVADNAAGGGLIPGPEVADWRGLDLLALQVDLRINGGDRIPMNAMQRTDPAVTLAWVANELSRRGFGLRAGQWVTPGSATQPVQIRAGDHVVARYESYGEISLKLEA